MKFICVVLFGLCCVFGVVLSKTMTADEEEALVTDIELDEYDIEEQCQLIIPYEEKKFFKYDYNSKEAAEAAEKYFEIRRGRADHYLENLKDESPTREDETNRKLELITRPGDILLPKEKYQKLLGFSNEVSDVVARKRKDCSNGCDLSSSDPVKLLSTWTSQTLSSTDSVTKEYPRILELVPEAARINGFSNVESYWLMLSDLEHDGYERALRLWEEIKPLYKKLHNLVATKLHKRYGKAVVADTTQPIPIYLLGSYLGDDWSNIVDTVLSNACVNTFHNIEKKMAEKNLQGKELYRKAERLTGFLHLGNVPKSFWLNSAFNHSCPAKTVNPCQSGVRVATCSTPSWPNYIDAHRIVMESISTEVRQASSLSFLLKSGNRYSAVDSAVSRLAEILASSRHYMAQYDLVTPTDDCALQTVLTLSALRLLPAMPYYLAADLARLQAIKTNNTDNIVAIWQKFQTDFQGIAFPGQQWWNFMADPQITSNQPLIDKFYGVLLQFHLFEELMTNSEESFSDAEEFIHKKVEFRTMLTKGISRKWPQLLNDIFDIKTVTSTPLLQFFSHFESTLSSVPSKATIAKINNNAKSVISSTTQKATVTDGTNNHTVFSNEVEAESSTTEDNEDEDNFGVSSYVLISCCVVVVIIISIVIARILWKKTRKNYEPPSHQNEPA